MSDRLQTAPPVELDVLFGPTDRPTTEAARPIGADRLDYEAKRRITIADHERWMQTGQPPHQDDADIDDLLEEIRRGRETP